MRRCSLILWIVVLAVGPSSLAHAATEYATFASFYKPDPTLLIIIGAVVAAAIAVVTIFLTGGTGGPVVLALGTFVGNLMGYSGAVATKVGLALLGGGSIAAGGLGMTGGAALLSAALTFGTTVVIDYSVDRGRAEYSYQRLRAQSAEMVNLPAVVNKSGSDAYKKAINILKDVDEDSLLASDDNAPLLEDAIAAVDEDPEASLSDSVRKYALLSVLRFQLSEFSEARRAAEIAIDHARKASVTYTVPAFVRAVSMLYDKERDLREPLASLRYAVVAEPDNPLLPFVFAIYMDRLMLTTSDDDFDRGAWQEILSVMQDPAVEKHKFVNLQLLLVRYVMLLKVNQQRIASLSTTENQTIREHPQTLRAVEAALSDYGAVLDSADAVLSLLFDDKQAGKRANVEKLESYRLLLSDYANDIGRLTGLTNALRSEHVAIEGRQQACEGWGAEGYFRTADADSVTRCIAHGQPLNEWDLEGLTPLYRAVLSTRDVDMIQALLDAGADPNLVVRGGRAPIHAAAWFNGASVVDALIQSGADVNARDKNGNVPLHAAVYHNDQSVVELLIASQAEVNEPNGDGMTPLHLSSWSTNAPAMVATLVSAGAEIDAKDLSGNTPLHLALLNETDVSTVSQFVNLGSNIEERNHEGNTFLHQAMLGEAAASVVTWLLEKGLDPRATNDLGRTPLHLELIGQGRTAVIRELIEAAPVASIRDDEGNSLLHVAAKRSDVSLLAMLMVVVPDVNVQNRRGDTALHVAARRPDGAQAISTLLSAQAMVNVANDEGDTPLHVAGINSDLNGVALLMDAGADVEARNNSGESALHAACLAGSDISVVAALIGRGARVDALDEGGNTALHMAAIGGYDALVQLLLGVGASAATRNEEGLRPVDIAEVYHEGSPLLETLRRAG